MRITLILSLFAIAGCSEPPSRNKIHWGKTSPGNGNVVNESNQNPSVGEKGEKNLGESGENGKPAKLLSTKFRALSSVEVQNTIEDLFALSIESLMGDHPQEASDTGFFNSVNSYSTTAPLVLWNSNMANYVATNMKAAAPILKGIQTCALTDDACLLKNLDLLASSLYRRPALKTELDLLLASIKKAVAKDAFDALRIAVEIMLQSPQFRFHLESLDENGKPQAAFALAARLASLIWQSAPDAELFAEAKKGSLTEGAALKAQVIRMLADKKALRGLGQFADEWLRLYTLKRRDATDATKAGVSAELLEGMLLETKYTVGMAATGKVDFLAEIFTPKHSYLTADLAKFYGIPSSNSSRAVPAQGEINAASPRRGLLTQASFLYASTKRSTTSVITRGNSVLESFLCKEAGAPDPGDLEEAAKDAAIKRTKREESTFRMGKIKCAGCHLMIDPIGLALEGFDFVGNIRTVDEVNDPVDPSSSFPLDGKKLDFSDISAVSNAFAKSEETGRCISKKMIDYAFAGNLSDPDDVFLGAVHKEFRESGNSFQSLILAIVSSPEFMNP